MNGAGGSGGAKTYVDPSVGEGRVGTVRPRQPLSLGDSDSYDNSNPVDSCTVCRTLALEKGNSVR